MRSTSAWVGLVLAFGCGAPGVPVDDAGSEPIDAATADDDGGLVTVDAGVVGADAGGADAGTARMDAGPPDAGPVDPCIAGPATASSTVGCHGGVLGGGRAENALGGRCTADATAAGTCTNADA